MQDINDLPEAPTSLPPIVGGDRPADNVSAPHPLNYGGSLGRADASNVPPPSGQGQPGLSVKSEPATVLPSQNRADAAQVSSARTTQDLQRSYADKARQVIEQNASDPYTACAMIEKIKQQYLRDVYHKDIKLPGR